MMVKPSIVITLSFIIKEVLSLYSLRLDISFDKFKYHEGSTELYSLRLDISFNELKNLECVREMVGIGSYLMLILLGGCWVEAIRIVMSMFSLLVI